MASTMLAAMNVLPVGYQFRPTDEELLLHYLSRKNLGREDSICVIPELDILQWEPPELPGKFSESSIIQAKDQQWWFFCEQGTGGNARRSTRGGFWKKTGETGEVKSRNTKQVIGSKKILTFFRGNSSNKTKTNWVMHEYHLPSNALNGLVWDNRKNYVLCMIKCNPDAVANSSPSHEFGGGEFMNIDILELEPDNVFIPEHLIEARMQLLEPLLRTPNHGVNANLQQFPLEWESIEMDSPFSASEGSDTFTEIFNQVLIDEDEPCAGYGMETSLDRRNDDIFETYRPHEQQAFVMQSKQTHKVESFHGFVPIDEKKGIVEDDLDESTVRVKAPRVKTEKETSNTISYVLLTEAKAQKHAPTKIKEEISSACSSSTSIHKLRQAAIQLEGHANTTKTKEITTIPALIKCEKAAGGKKQVAAKRKPVSSSLAHNCRNGPSMVYMWNAIVGIIVLKAIFFEIFNL